MLQSADDRYGEMRTLTYMSRCRNASLLEVTLPDKRRVDMGLFLPASTASNSPYKSSMNPTNQPNQSINQHEMAYLLNQYRPMLW